MAEKEKTVRLLTTEEIERELERVRYKERYGKTMRSTIYALITVAAIAVLVAVLLLPVLQIYGVSMSPTLKDGDIVISIKGADIENQDIVAFYYNNKILIKRAIAQAGDWIDMDMDGTVHVNGKILDEPYITDKALGECNINFPYQVPEGKIFVMGDHRSVSVDSRNSAVGCVSEEQIVGKLVMCVWPPDNFGVIGK